MRNTATVSGAGFRRSGKRRICLFLLMLTLICLCPAQVMAAAKLKKSKLTIKTGNACVLKLTGNSANKKVTWSTSSKAKVKIISKTNRQVVLKAKKAGKAVITAKIGKKKLRCNITVRKNAAFPTKLTLIKGDTYTFSYGKKASWSVSDTTLGRVTAKSGKKKGSLKALASGTFKLTAKSGKKTKTCTVKVLTKAGRLVSAKTPATTISANTLTFNRLEMSASLMLLQNGKKVEGVTWSSSAPNVAVVSETGFVRPVANGKAVITGEAGGKKYTCNVTVDIEEDEEQAEKKQATVSRSVTFVKTGMVTTLKSAGSVSGKLDWKSADTKVAEVSTSGENKIIRSKGAGRTTVSAVYGGKTYIYNIEVKLATISSDKTLDEPVIVRNQTYKKSGNYTTLKLFWFGTKGAEKQEVADAVWESKDSSIISVTKDKDGVYRARPVKSGTSYKNGSTSVFCKYKGGTFTFNITVAIPATAAAEPEKETASMEISAGSASLTAKGAQATLKVNNLTGITASDVAWKSSNTKVATVSPAKGASTKVTAVANGTATITAEAKSGSETVSVTCKVTVKIPEEKPSVTLVTKTIKSGSNTLVTYKAPSDWTATVTNSAYTDFAFVLQDKSGEHYVNVMHTAAAFKNKKSGIYYKKVMGSEQIYVIPDGSYTTSAVFAGFVRVLGAQSGVTTSSKVLKKVGSSALTGDVLHVQMTGKKNGKTNTDEAIFFGNVSNLGSMIYTPANMPDLKLIDPDLEYNVDYGFLAVTNLTMMGCPKAEFDDYAETLVQVYNSIQYSDYFMEQHAKASGQNLQAAKDYAARQEAASDKQLAAFLDYLRN